MEKVANKIRKVIALRRVLLMMLIATSTPPDCFVSYETCRFKQSVDRFGITNYIPKETHALRS